jgi:DNA-binding response OmpR family regulator
MLTYVIEDSTPKADRMVHFLQERFPHLKVRVFGSYHSGLSAIVAEVPALLLLDMSLPNFDRKPNAREGRLRPLGGYELLRKLRLRDLSPKVIIVSQLEEFGKGQDQVTFKEIVERCNGEFPGLMLGSVYFGQGSTSPWQRELGSLLDALSVRETL